MQMLKANNFTRSKAHVALLSYQKEMFLDLPFFKILLVFTGQLKILISIIS